MTNFLITNCFPVVFRIIRVILVVFSRFQVIFGGFPLTKSTNPMLEEGIAFHAGHAATRLNCSWIRSHPSERAKRSSYLRMSVLSQLWSTTSGSWPCVVIHFLWHCLQKVEHATCTTTLPQQQSRAACWCSKVNSCSQKWPTDVTASWSSICT